MILDPMLFYIVVWLDNPPIYNPGGDPLRSA